MTQSFWLEASSPPVSPVLRGQHRADVVVLGAGLAGCMAALTLAEAGVSVVWLEAGRVGCAATGRNAGMILQGTAERYNRAITLMGRQRARDIHQASLTNHTLIRETVARLSIDCGYRQGGSLQLAGSPAEEEELRQSAALLQEDGFRAEVVEDLSPALASAGFSVGVHLAEDGEIHPVAFVHGVAQAAVGAGARLFEGSRVTQLDPTPGAVVAQTEHGVVEAELAVVCLNAHLGDLVPWCGNKVDPVRGQMLATAPLPQLFPTPVYADHGYDYWRQLPDGRIVLGGWRNLDPDGERGFKDQLHPGIQDKMLAFLRRFPALGDPAVTHRWSGTMGFSADGLPLVGPIPGGALVAGGFTGHGFGFAALAGQSLAQVVIGDEPALVELLSPYRFAG